MKLRRHIIMVALASVFVWNLARADKPQAQADANQAKQQLAAMDWLAGTWSGAMWGGTFEAYYTTPDGGRIISHSRLIKNGKEAFYEFEMFEVRDGAVQMAPFPGGKRVVGLTLADLDRKQRKATFENKNKDYPTRIEYHRAADDRLVITLSDPHGSSDKREVFDLKRNVD